MRTKTFKTEAEANSFAELQRANRYIVDGVYPPMTIGGKGISGLWVVWYH